MSDSIKHECAVAMVRIKNPDIASVNGLAKLTLLLEKQHNRGQDGAGMCAIVDKPTPGTPAYRVVKSAAHNPLADLLGKTAKLCDNFDARSFLGHLRYATFGKGDETYCHPFVHKEARLAETLLLAGNFNLTNTRELFEEYAAQGFHPEYQADGYLLCELIARNLGSLGILGSLGSVIGKLDGAFTLCGMTGDGWSFAVRDAHGIRPGYYYISDDYVAVASERPAIQAAFDAKVEDVHELPPGVAMLVSPKGKVEFKRLLLEEEKKSCVFERIYFSRANDADIHHERKALGAALAEPILKAVNYDLEHTFFSYIPNSAQVAFHGLLEELMRRSVDSLKAVAPSRDALQGVQHVPRFGQIAIKDAKFRTFIADAAARREFYKHVYDVTYGLIEPNVDTLVVLDDSIVRGNTMKNAILPMLDRLQPKKIIVASSAPPICYPDCYGIDMSSLGELVAFKAMLNLNGGVVPTTPDELRTAYDKVGSAPRADRPPLWSAIADLLKPNGLNADLEVVFQTMEGLRKACPNTSGDWYFTGNYPTPGGERVLQHAIDNYIKKVNDRSY